MSQEGSFLNDLQTTNQEKYETLKEYMDYCRYNGKKMKLSNLKLLKFKDRLNDKKQHDENMIICSPKSNTKSQNLNFKLQARFEAYKPKSKKINSTEMQQPSQTLYPFINDSDYQNAIYFKEDINENNKRLAYFHETKLSAMKNVKKNQ